MVKPSRGNPPRADRKNPESDRYVPLKWEGKLIPNFHCRGWNAKRSKYCTHRAGAGTDHPGEGRCKWHGGSLPRKHGRYSKQLTSEKFSKIIQDFDGDDDPLDLLPELALMRAIVVDYINRYEEITEALLSWYYSFSDEYHKEVQEAHAMWIEQNEHIESEEREPFMPPIPIPDKPRKVIDLIAAGQLLDKIGAMVKRVEDIANRDALPRSELIMLAQEMGRVVEQANNIPDAGTRLRTIKNGWTGIRLRMSGSQNQIAGAS